MSGLILRVIIRHLRQEHGAIAVMFAIMFPLLMMFYSVAFDGANLQSSRARLADGLNQGVLAIAIIDNRNATAKDQAANISMLRHYLSYYLPDASISEKDLSVTATVNHTATTPSTLESVDYAARGKVGVRSLIGAQGNVGFDSSVGIRADSGAGVVRKMMEEIPLPTDYAFVLDFSGSMLDSSSEPGFTRIELLRKVVTNFMGEILNDAEEKNTVAIIPFGSGVPVILPGENIAGGKRFGCSNVGKLKSKFSNVDMDFWYNKTYIYTSTSAAPTEIKQSYSYDYSLYDYYRNVIGPATGLNINDMTNNGWCVKNNASDKDRAPYSCDADPRSRLFSHYTEFSDNRKMAHELMFLANQHYGLFNIDSMDYDGLFANGYMFTEQSVTTFNYTVGSEGFRPFVSDCLSAFYYVNYATASSILKNKSLKPASYLIELTNDPSIIPEFNAMTIASNGVLTNVSSGLLRSLPVIAKGTNPRKMIVVISDGLDSGYHTYGPYALTNELFKTYDLCSRIRNGLLKYPAGTTTEEADIFFIFTVDNYHTKEALDLWRDHCAGDNVYLATNYHEITNVLMGIARKSSIKFINKNEPN